MKSWPGLNKDVDPNDLQDGESPDCSNVRPFNQQKGTLGPRPGFVAVSPTAFSGNVVGLGVYRLPQSNGNYWAVALDDGSSVTITLQAAQWQDPGATTTLPTSAVTIACGTAMAVADIEWDLLGTSGAFAYTLTTPHGTYSLNTAEVDGAAVKSATLGCLTCVYSGASRGSRGILTIRGLFVVGTYSHTLTKTGAIVDSSDGVVIVPCHYTSAAEGYAASALTFGQIIAPLKVLNTPVTFAV